MRIATLSIISTLVLALTGSTALAQSPSTRGYDADTQILGEVGEVSNPPVASQAPSRGAEPEADTAPVAAAAPVTEAEPVKGNLPFTGFEAGLTLAMGLALLGSGLVVRRLSRRGDVA